MAASVLIKSTIFLTVVALSVNCWADSSNYRLQCPADKEFRLDQNGLSASNLAVRDQGYLGTCGDSVAAEMTDAYLVSHSKTSKYFHTSALDAAVIANIKLEDWYYSKNPHGSFRPMVPNGPLDAADVCWAFNGMKSYGACPDSLVEEKMYNALHGSAFGNMGGLPESIAAGKKDWARLWNLPRWIYQDFECVKNPSADCKKSIASSNASSIYEKAKDLDHLLTCDARKDALKVPLDIDELESALSADRPAEVMLGVISHGCEGKRVSLKNIQCSMTPFETDTPINDQQIHSWLHSPNPQPIGIAIHQDFLENGVNSSPSHAADHAVLIIGERACNDPQTGMQVLQLLLRNSWGISCKGYSKDWQCDGENPVNQNGTGSVWVDENTVLNNLVAAYRLEASH